jgi:hypothetical protein
MNYVAMAMCIGFGLVGVAFAISYWLIHRKE